MTFILSNWKTIALGLLLASFVLFFKLWRSEVDDFTAYRIEVSAFGKQAEIEAKRIEYQHQKTLEDVTNAWTRALPQYRANAVSSYLSRYPAVLQSSTCGGPLSVNANSTQSPNGAREKQVASCPAGFIEDAAEDAGKLEAWQEWARSNSLPVR